MNRQNVEDIYRLSPIQQGILFHCLFEPDGVAYFEQFHLTVEGAPAEEPSLEEPWRVVVARHPALRTSFLWEGLDEPVQVVHKSVHLPICTYDFQDTPHEDQPRKLAEFLEEDRRTGFDLTQAPLMRISVLHWSNHRYTFVMSYHHLVVDGWSYGLLAKEVLALQAGQAAGRPVTLPEAQPFRNYVTWLHRQDSESAAAYWRRQLQGFERPTPLGWDVVPGGRARRAADYGQVELRLDETATRQLQTMAQRSRLTLNTVFQGAWGHVLARGSGHGVVFLGVTVSGRPVALRGSQEMVGCFINTLPVRVEVPSTGDLVAWLRSQQAESVELRRYEHSQLVDLRRWAGIPGDRELFDSIVVFENFDTKLMEAASNQAVQRFQRTNYPLTVVVEPNRELLVQFTYDRLRVAPETVDRLARHLEETLLALAGGATDLADLPLAPARDRELLAAWNDATAVFPSADTLAGRFARQAAERPEAVAVTLEGERLTYAELEARANRLARRLAAWGVGPESRVGLVAERSLELVAGILGIVKAGGAYIPFDPAVPPERLAFLVADCGAPLILVGDGLAERLQDGEAPPAARLESLSAALAGEGDPGAPPVALEPDHLAYGIYTSGSTGKPKGSLLTHRNVLRLFDATDSWFDFGPQDVWTLFHSYAFDFSVWELWGALLYGGRLVVVPYWVSRSPEAFHELLGREGVTVLNQTPSAFKQLVSVDVERPVDALNRLRTVIFGGEALEPSSLAPWYARHGEHTRLVNMYGITETTVHVTYRPMTSADAAAGGASPVGMPIPDLQIHLLDALGRPVPVGVPGELHVGGAGLARGYLGRAALTAERFVPNPFAQEGLPTGSGGAAGSRLYRSGDLARWRVDGELEFLGRIDLQVKIRGFRIELGEIEATLVSHPAVREVAVVAREDRPGDQRLVAYVVPAPDGPPATAAELKTHAARRLPEYMVPSAIVELAALPLTVNGKLDRRALPVPETAGESAADHQPPQGPTEEAVAAVWAEVLGVERVGRNDDFFDLGGHSLLATKVAGRLRTALSCDVPLPLLFEWPRLADLAAALATPTAGEATQIPVLPRAAAGPSDFVTSFAQERLWFLDQFEPGSAVYNIPTATRLAGELNLNALAAALADLAARQESLRTTFTEDPAGGPPRQVVAERGNLSLNVVDLRSLPPAEREAAAAERAGAEALAPFALARGPLCRVTALRLTDTETALLVTVHHIVSDGWSQDVFVRELGALYAARAAAGPLPKLPPLALGYADFAAWQRGHLSGEELERQLEFWRRELADVPTLLDIPADRPRPAVQSFRGAVVPFRLPDELSTALRAHSQATQATIFQLLLAAFGAFLGRLTGQDDLTLGSPVSGRELPGLESLIGFFVNTLVLRQRLDGRPGFDELVRRSRAGVLAALAHQDVPFEKLVEELAPSRSLASTPLFQAMLAFQNPQDAGAAVDGDGARGLRLRGQAQEIRISKFDLTLNVLDFGTAFAGHWAYRTDLFDTATVERFRRGFEIFLAACLAHPEQSFRRLPMLAPEERQQILVDWNRPRLDYPSEGFVHELFAERAAADPERVAVVFEGETLTYGELDRRANHLAQELTARGIGPDAIVGVLCERSFELPVALLAVLKAGGGYLPLDPDLPADRLGFLIEDSQVPLVLAQERHAETIAGYGRAAVLLLDGPALAGGGPLGPAVAPAPALTPDNAAYVIYTSGSTGQPKGVVVHHGALSNRLRFAAANDVGADHAFLQKTTISFDVSVLEIFAPLISGGRTVLSRPRAQNDLAYLVDLIERERVTHTSFPPTMLYALFEQDGFARLGTLQSVVTGGEAVPAELPGLFYEAVTHGQAESSTLPALFNRYGPTEATISVTSWACRPGAAERVLPIGFPTAKAEVYLLDRELQSVPVGIPGEIYLGGRCVARGYLARPGKTAETFVPDSFSGRAGDRLYKTGDLARFRPDGALEFVGRIDRQVKIRGFRVELGEIESVLLRHPAVREAAVVDWGEGTAKTLAAYLVAIGSQEPGSAMPAASELRDLLTAALPAYMVPTSFQWLERLPLSPTGKVDRKALPPPERAGRGVEEGGSPVGDTETTLAAIWAEVLGLNAIGREANFFELGGHSLLATRVISRARAAFGVELPLRTLFEEPTVAALAREIDRVGATATEGSAPPIVPVSREGEIPLSFAQERLWFLERMDVGRGAYNIPVALGLRGPLDVDRLRRSLEALVARHEALRTTFATGRRGTPIQVIADAVAVPLAVEPIALLDGEALDEAVQRLSAAEADEPFDIAVGPLLRARLLQVAADDHVFLLTVHHLVSDGWSAQLMLQEIGTLYRHAADPAALAPLTLQYADFAHWQRAWLSGDELDRQLGYWRDALSGAPDVLELPFDRPRPAVAGAQGLRRPVQLAGSWGAAFDALAERTGTTPFMVLLAAWGTLLGRLAGVDDLLVGAPVANRNRREIENLVGFFVNTLVFRVNLAGDPSFAELLTRVRATTLGAYDHQDLPFEKLVAELAPSRSRAHSPLFQVMLVLQNAAAAEAPRAISGAETGELGMRVLLPAGSTTKFDLTLSLSEGATAAGKSFTGFVASKSELFDPTTIERWLGSFEHLLAAAVAHPERTCSALPLLRAGEEHQLLREWHGAVRQFPARGVVERFAEWTRRTPDAVALVAPDDSALSFAELDRRAEALAQELVRRGAGPETVVAVCWDRSPELVVAFLAVLRTGAAYLPLEPSHPDERLAELVADARPVAILAGPPHRARLAGALAGLDDGAPDSAAAVAWPAPEPETLAYWIYTSGSTGRPKPVGISHGALAERLAMMDELFGLGPGDRQLQFVSVAFDMAVEEIFATLASGATLVLVSTAEIKKPSDLLARAAAQGVTKINLPASLWHQIADDVAAGTVALPPTLRLLVTGAEEPSPEKFATLLAACPPAIQAFNLYGPTETTIIAAGTRLPTRVELGRQTAIPLGRPLPGSRLTVADAHLRPVPIGVAGELLIAGEGLARGYVGRPAVTAERFVPDACSPTPGARAYRTGDRVRHRADGTLEFLGRLDQQVKIRGFRIELGEIEEHLRRHPALADAAVVARPDVAGGAARLVAYLVAVAGGAPPAVPELRAFLLERIPEALVPAVFVPLAALPHNASGKVDRRALPAPGLDRPELGTEYLAPRNELERVLATLVAEVLGVRRAGLLDNFFDLGGDSLKGAVLINRLEQALGEYVYVTALFDTKNLAELAEYLTKHYPRAVAERFGIAAVGAEEETAGSQRRGRVTAERVRELRRIVTPLAPFVAPPDLAINPPAVFLLSPPRSGSTLLRVLLAGHPGVFAPPEIDLLSFDTLAERRAAFSGRYAFWLEGLVRAVMAIDGCDAATAEALLGELEARGATVAEAYGWLQQRIGGRLLVDKTPSYALDPQVLARAEALFDRPKYVHLLRHPYGMIRSFEEARIDQTFFRHDHAFHRRELAELVWLASQENILAHLATIEPERHTVVRFEDLVADPRPELERLAAFLGIDFDPEMLEPYKERERRMTDGVHPLAKMLGDVKFHQHQGIDAQVADRWREAYPEDFLGEITWRMAEGLGYAGPRERTALVAGGWREGEALPLSFGQERLWFLERLGAGGAAYHLPTALALSGAVDPAVVARALSALVARHAALRTTFEEAADGPVQRVLPSMPPGEVALEQLDFSGEAPERAYAAALEFARRPFDLETGPPFRAALVRRGPEDHLLVLVMHHIVSDGWSLSLAVRELGALYGAFAAGRPDPLPPLALQYPDFARWQRRHLQGGELERQQAFWRTSLANVAALELPLDRPRPAVQRFRGAGLAGTLPAATGTALLALGRAERASAFMVLSTVFSALLARVAGQDDFALGTPVAGRNRRELEDLVGFFVNTLALRQQYRPEESFRQALGRARVAIGGALENQDVPFEHLVEVLQPERHLSRSPIFQVMFSLQDLPGGAVEGTGLGFRPVELDVSTAKFDLTLAAITTGGRVTLRWVYDTDLFDAATVERLAGALECLATGIAADPDRPLGQIELLSPAERAATVAEATRAAATYPAARPLSRLIEEQVDRTPQAVAVTAGERSLTFAELDSSANRLARRLTGLGCGPEDRVGVVLDRHADLVVALLAVLKSGAAYVPVDPSFPAQRLAYVLADAGVRVVVTEPSLEAALAPSLPAGAELLVLAPGALDGESAERLVEEPDPQSVAYVLYTSGSTGRPKGVAVPQRALVNFLTAMAQRPGFGAGDTMLAVTTVSFDIAALELLLPLVTGGRTVLATREQVTDGAALRELLAASSASHLQATPATWRLLLEAGWRPAPGFTVLCGGEAFPRELAMELGAGDEVPIWNLYGPTETTVWSAATRVRAASGPVPFGEPVANNELWLVDRPGLLVPQGVAGELLIGGEGVARGYLGRAALTAERFVPDAFSGRPGARVYRTGDRVRRRADGLFDFLGRLDFQVKLRGFRIELGEIESALGAHPGLAEVAVALDVAAPGPAAGEPRLVAWFVARERPPGEDELRRHLLARLPAYMVPSAFVALTEFPRTANGKLDRRRLTAPAAPAGDPVAPRTETEFLVAGLFAELLGLDAVGAEDGFFARGGHSLLAARLVARVRRDLGVELPLRQIFESPRVADLARAIELIRQRQGGRELRPPLVPQARPEALPLSFAQERMWFLERLDPGSALYNLPLAVRRRGAFDRAIFQDALDAAVARHESLRTCFPAFDGQPVAVIDPPFSVPVSEVDVSTLPASERETAVSATIRALRLEPFDLGGGPLLRAAVIRRAADDHHVVVIVHHLNADGSSVDLLARELAAPGVRPALPVQYADYALDQRATASAERFAELLARRQDRLADAPRVTALPLDRPRGARASASGGRVTVPFSENARRSLDTLARTLGATRFMVLLAALGAVLERFGAGADVVLGTPVSGRDREELQGIVGLFVNTLALRLTWSSTATFGDLVAIAREVTLDGHADQELPFEQLVQALAPERDLATTPIFQVMLNFQEGGSWGSEEAAAGQAAAGLVGFDLTLSARAAGDRLGATLEYRTELFDPETVARLARGLALLLDAAAEQPATAVGDLPVFAETERRQLLAVWGETPAAPDATASDTLHGAVAAYAVRTPDAVAVVGRGLDGARRETTYRQLDEQANALAVLLIERGVGPEARVGVFLERSQELIPAILAVLKAGGTWVPLDTSLPDERLELLIADGAVRWAITESLLHARLPAALRDAALVLDPAATLPRRASAPVSPVGGANAAYLIYTSGSTGRPKGVVIEHRTIARWVAHEGPAYGYGPGERGFHLLSIGFDGAVLEIFTALASGATLVLAEPDVLASSERFFAAVAAEGITRLFLVTALWRELGAVPPPVPPPAGLRSVLFGGERADRESFQRWRAWLGDDVDLVNLYGPTEVSVVATRWPAPAALPSRLRDLPIGRPVDGGRAVVLDARGRLLAPGAAGELAIGGPHLARGYLDRPAITADHFRPDPFAAEPGARRYLTGDLVRWSAAGELHYVGRTDEQVKVRGFRVELGEVEARLAALPGVREALVLARTAEDGSRHLVAWVVAEEGERTTSEALARQLQQVVPPYMVPEAILRLDEFPLTAQGKVDRRALPNPERRTPATSTTAPRNPLEAAICEVFAETLGLPSVGIEDDFFAAGGHSLLAVRLHARLEARLGRRLAVADLFRAPSPGALAAALEQAPEEALLPPTLVELRRGGDRPPLFLVHPASGELALYRELVALLPAEQPVFGFESPNLRAPDAPLPASVEALAEIYLEALRAFRPEGPYHLAGSSLGGAVAYEMACRLVADGAEVAFLGLVDTPQSGLQSGPAAMDPASVRQAALRLLVGAPAEAGPQPGAAEQELGALLARADELGALPRGLSAAQIEALLALVEAHARILGAYRPQPFPGRLTFFRAAESAATHDEGRVPWNDLAAGGIEVVEIPGGHVSVHRAPHVAVLAKALTEALETAGASPAAIPKKMA